MPTLHRLSGAVAAAAALASTLSWHATPLRAAAKVTMVGPWRILAGTSSAGAYCTMQLGAMSDKLVGVQVRANGLTFMSVGDPGWSFPSHEQMAAKIAVDGAPVFEGNAIAVLPHVVVIPLPQNSKTIDAIAAGKSLVATAGKGSATFELAGADAARDALKTCLADAGKP